MNIRHAALLTLALAASGCTVSEHGICPKDGGDQAVFDPDLLGEWMVVTNDAASSKEGPRVNVDGGLLRFDRLKDDSKTYLIGSPTADAAKAAKEPPNVGHLVPLGPARFLDVIAVDPEDKAKERHVLLKVERHDDVVFLRLMNPQYFEAHPSALPMSAFSVKAQGTSLKGLLDRLSFELPMITAGTPELRKFLQGHADDAELWADEWTIKLRRVGGKAESARPSR